MDFLINTASDLWHHSDFQFFEQKNACCQNVSGQFYAKSTKIIRPVNSNFLHHISSALLLQALMRREKPAAEQGIWRQQFCATKKALAPVQMQLTTCSGTASIPPRASTICSLTCLFSLLIPYFEHLPNLDTSSSSPSANRSLSVTFITPTPRRRISVPRYVSAFDSATICTTHLPLNAIRGAPLITSRVVTSEWCWWWWCLRALA